MSSSPVEPNWITPDQLVEINRKEAVAEGEPHRVLDLGKLDSAAARPKNLWALRGEEDVLRLAACLAVGVARSHAFLQGNHRTAAHAAVLFIELNGYVWTKEDDEQFGQLIAESVLHNVDETELAEWMRQYVREASSFQGRILRIFGRRFRTQR